MARRKVRKLSKKESKALKKASEMLQVSDVSRVSDVTSETKTATAEVRDGSEAQKTVLEIPKIITVREFAQILNLPVTKVITELMKNGVIASINESIDFDTASILGDELGYEIKSPVESHKSKVELTEEEKKHLVFRPPVVVIMGHVDHGKTTLLDAIRNTNVVESESGGITQHIGAYQVEVRQSEPKFRGSKTDRGILRNTQDDFVKINKITFLDTPGHEAFSAMRAHGANITDIAILVVAADDGVKPQTKEAISHAKAAGIPIIVAINKIDKPEADIERVKRELADLDLLTEEWGGKTIIVPVSAKQNKGIDELLDMILVVSEMEDLKANPLRPAQGVVIESHMQAGMGPIATILVQEGTLKIGQVVLIGSIYGKIRLMENYLGKRITSASPSMPVRIAGLNGVCSFGEILDVTVDERTAKNKLAAKDIQKKIFGLAQISEEAKKGELKELNIILKADVDGSLSAIKNSLQSIVSGNVKVKIISDGVGDISESDINMAVASKALVIGFRVSASASVAKLAEEKGIKISKYDIIYNLIDDISAALEGMLEPEFIEEIMGKLEVIKVFYSTKNHKIVGGKVVDGKLESGLKAHLYHSGKKHGEGKITTLKLEQNPVSEVLKGFECGVGIDTERPIKPKDLIEAYKTEEVMRRVK